MKIPKDLKPGDRLWYSETRYATVCPARGDHETPYFMRVNSDRTRGRICAQTSDGRYMNYWCDTGCEFDHDTPPIVRIERIASKPKREKVDKDAAWLLREIVEPIIDNASYGGPGAQRWRREAKRLRAIAKRLNGGRMP